MKAAVRTAVALAVLAAGARGAAAAEPMVHDHGARHGGLVGMVGMRHLECLATPEGIVRVYPSDMERNALPLVGAGGRVVSIDEDGAGTAFPLAVVATPTGPALQAELPPLQRSAADLRFEVELAGESIDMSILLPVAWAWLGDAVPPQRTGPTAAQPELLYGLRFARPINALVADGDQRFVVAPFDMAATVRAVADGTKLATLATPEPVIGEGPGESIGDAATQASGDHDHSAAMLAHAAGVLAVDEETRRLACGHVGQLAVHTLADTRMQTRWNLPELVPWALDWFPGDGGLLVAYAHRPFVDRLAAADGTRRSRYALPSFVRSAAVNSDGARVAVAHDPGRIAVLDAGTGAVARTLETGPRSIRAMAFHGSRLWAAGEGGALLAWDGEGARELWRQEGLGPLAALAVHRQGGVVATAGFKGDIFLVRADDGRPLARLVHHRDLVTGLAWVGDRLVSGDAAGEVAVWAPEVLKAAD